MDSKFPAPVFRFFFPFFVLFLILIVCLLVCFACNWNCMAVVSQTLRFPATFDWKFGVVYQSYYNLDCNNYIEILYFNNKNEKGM